MRLNLHKDKNSYIYIVGDGNIGNFLAVMLRYNKFVQIISKKHQGQKKLILQTPDSNITASVTYQSKDNINCKPDIIIMATKSYDLRNSINDMRQHIKPNTIIILVQNGLGAHTVIKDLITNNPIIAAPLSYGVKTIALQTLFSSLQGIIQLGQLSGKTLTLEQQQQIKNMLQKTEINWQWQHNIEQKIKQKFAINCIINPLTVIYNCQNGSLKNIAGCKYIIEKLANEISNTISDIGWSSEELITETNNVITLTATNKSSMLTDYRNNKATELEFINKKLSKIAKKNNIEIPVNSAILCMLSTLIQRQNNG